MNQREVSPGVWVEAEPMPFIDQIDFEVFAKAKGWEWHAFRGARLLAAGSARTRAGLYRSIAHARRRLVKQEGMQ